MAKAATTAKRSGSCRKRLASIDESETKERCATRYCERRTLMARVAINGHGRMGRATLTIVMDTPGLDLVAANDLGTPDDVAYLLKYDTVYGRYAKKREDLVKVMSWCDNAWGYSSQIVREASRIATTIEHPGRTA
jgi:glyceraldehyde-3-phosphate dehydrogenase/erythrose-4-phosphate dehydrogenase